MKRWMLPLLLLLTFATPTFAQSDDIPISSVNIVHAPDVKSWAKTTTITLLQFDGSTTRVDFTKHNGDFPWPDVTPKGWNGPLQYTLWLFVKQDGQWMGSAFIQFWRGRVASGSASDPDVPSLYHKNWYYDARWAPISNHGPIQPGEQIGFMVTSGNQRDSGGPDSVQERSNIVVVSASDNRTFTWGTTPTPEPVPTPVPVPVPDPTPIPDPLQPRLEAIERSISTVEVTLNTIIANFEMRIVALERDFDTLANKVDALGARTIPTSCKVTAFGIPLACRLGQ